MMNKTIFLFLLFLTIFGAVNVTAKVRIGGEIAPNASAVLDLNHNNTDNANGGFLLPRVRLESYTDSTVFGPGVTPASGLLVYNMNNDTDYNRPPKGAYSYNGANKCWVAVAVDNEAGHIVIANNISRLWLGVNGEGKKTLKATVNIYRDTVVITDDVKNDVKYKWTLFAIGYEPVDTITDRPELTVNSALLSSAGLSLHTSYSVALTVRYRGTEKKQTIATVAVGPGAWIGGNRWLQVANTNLGAIEDIPLDVQLNMTHGTEMSDSLGYLFQWGSTCYRALRTTNTDTRRERDVLRLSSDSLNELNGQLKEKIDYAPDGTKLWREVFIKGDTTIERTIINGDTIIKTIAGDWREHKSSDLTNDPLSDWTWNVNVSRDSTNYYTLDPCRDRKDGRWRVPTVEDWDSIRANNEVRLVNGEGGRNGVMVTVKDDDSNIPNLSFFLPETKWFNFDGKISKSPALGYWFNDNAGLNSDRTRAEAWAIFSGNDGTEALNPQRTLRSFGLNIRCVADEGKVHKTTEKIVSH
ncbi:MAG: fibrobacter succinogenes major paralogous domain-containing protein [Dysgonamonadaceae bacterium]|nr:fibrobacter succinogenes major paralogous domain-containing protein [Dysgonamonadaceae bacterium]